MDTAGLIADAARRHGHTVAVAESLTGGMLSGRLAAAPGAAEWYRGAIVAYAAGVKYDLLDVPDGPVVSEEAAVAMARGACRLLGATVAVAVTGVGGPGRQDGERPGTVWIAVGGPDGYNARIYHVPGSDAAEICEATCAVAERALLAAVHDCDTGADRVAGVADPPPR